MTVKEGSGNTGKGRKGKSTIPSLFKPGESGNPNGRPKRGHALSDQLRAMMASRQIKIECTIKGINGKKETKKWELKSSHDFNAVISMALIEKAVQGDVYAFNSIADRLEGRAIQTNLNFDPGSEFKNLPLEDKQKMLAQLVAKTLE